MVIYLKIATKTRGTVIQSLECNVDGRHYTASWTTATYRRCPEGFEVALYDAHLTSDTGNRLYSCIDAKVSIELCNANFRHIKLRSKTDLITGNNNPVIFGVLAAYIYAGNWDAYAFNSDTPVTGNIVCSRCDLEQGADNPPFPMDYYKLWVEPRHAYEYPVYFAFPAGFINAEDDIYAVAKEACFFLCSGEEDDLCCPRQVDAKAFLNQEDPEEYVAALIAEEAEEED